MRRLWYVPIFTIVFIAQLVFDFNLLFPFVTAISAADIMLGLPSALLSGFLTLPFEKTMLLAAVSVLVSVLFYKYISFSWAPAVSVIVCFLLSGSLASSLVCIPFCMIFGRISDA